MHESVQSEWELHKRQPTLRTKPITLRLTGQNQGSIEFRVLGLYNSVFPVVSISRDFPLADHTLPTRPEPAWPKIAQILLKCTTQPVDIEAEDRSPTTDRRWLKKARVPHREGNSIVGPPTP